MSVPRSHLRHQGQVIGALGRLLVSGMGTRRAGGTPDFPGPEIRMTVPPRNQALVRDYAKWCGAPEHAYDSTVPVHLFPQWVFPVLSRLLISSPHAVSKALNQGCRLTANAPIPAGLPLELTGRLEAIDEDDRRTRIHQRVTTGTADHPEALVTDVYVAIPKPRKKGSSSGRRDRPVVEDTAVEIGRHAFCANAGADFAILTGDINPIHWLRPYAKMAGFPDRILHGFASLAVALEVLTARRWGGDGSRLQSIDVRFTKPLVLPAEVGVYVIEEAGSDPRISVASGVGTEPYMVGTLTERVTAEA